MTATHGQLTGIDTAIDSITEFPSGLKAMRTWVGHVRGRVALNDTVPVVPPNPGAIKVPTKALGATTTDITGWVSEHFAVV